MRIELSDHELTIISEALCYRRDEIKDGYSFVDGADARAYVRSEYRAIVRLLGVRHPGKLDRGVD